MGGGATPAAGSWGPTGLSRMFSSSFGGQIAWLLPAALVLGAAVLWFTRRAPRTDRRRAAVLLWGGWLLVTGIVFSCAQGIIHQYYTVALAPAVGALVGIGAVVLWRERGSWWARAVLAVTLALTSIWSFTLLSRTASWHPELRAMVLSRRAGHVVRPVGGGTDVGANRDGRGTGRRRHGCGRPGRVLRADRVGSA